MKTSKKTSKNATSTLTTKARVAKQRAKAAPPKAKPGPTGAVVKKPASAPERATKTGKILDLLRRPDGVTLTELVKATGWQPNSVRGFLSGTIGKKFGTPVESFKNSDGDRFYRLTLKEL
jgi:hypothetical protein